MKGFGRKVCKRGCPPTYDTALILTLMVVQNLYDFSFRETLEFCKEIFGKVPALSSYHERVKSMPIGLIADFTAFVGERLIKKTVKSIDTVIADGTGFSYSNLYPLVFFRGKNIREVKSHVRVVATIGVMGKSERIVMFTNAGGAYSSELKLVLPTPLNAR